MSTLVFLLEEPSAQDALEGILPRILPGDIDVQYLVFEGKQDLERRMGRRMRAWLQPDTRFIVLRDQDNGDCRTIKSNLVKLCRDAGKPDTLIRIACRELESWFVGDLAAVSKAFSLPKLSEQQRKAIYRDPDVLANPVSELRKFIPTYQKRDGARRIGPYLSVEKNCSHSFMVFVDAVRGLVHGS